MSQQIGSLIQTVHQIPILPITITWIYLQLIYSSVIRNVMHVALAKVDVYFFVGFHWTRSG